MAACALLLPGCGAADLETTYKTDAPEVQLVEEIAQPLNELKEDRPLVAAIERVESGVANLWVFVCNHTAGGARIRRNIKTNYRNQPDNAWSGWQTIASSKSCRPGETPTVGKWAGDTPNETILLYWRDQSDNLIEVRFLTSGSTTTSDLTATRGVGKLNGPPAIAQTSNTTGAIQAVSVAFVERDAASSKKMWTVDFKGGAWQPRRPIMTALGAQAAGHGSSQHFTTAYSATPGAGFSKPMIAHSSSTPGVHRIFTRSFWTRDFTETARIIDNSFYCGLIGLGGMAGFSDDLCADFGCAMVRTCAGGDLHAASLQNSGSLSAFLDEYDTFSGAPAVLGTLYSVADGVNESFIGVAKGDFAAGFGLVGVTYIDHQVFGISSKRVEGAPTLANSALRQVFFPSAESVDCHLQYVDFQSFFNLGEVDLGRVPCPTNF